MDDADKTRPGPAEVAGTFQEDDTEVDDLPAEANNLSRVNGKITYDGKPLADARIRMEGVDGGVSRVYSCDSKEDGSFEIEAAYSTAILQGAPVGRYKVLVGKFKKEAISERRSRRTGTGRTADRRWSGSIRSCFKIAGQREIQSLFHHAFNGRNQKRSEPAPSATEKRRYGDRTISLTFPHFSSLRNPLQLYRC